jgi:hypothetical protein
LYVWSDKRLARRVYLLSILGAERECSLSVLGTKSLLSWNCLLSWKCLLNVHDEALLGRRLGTTSFHRSNEVRPFSVRSRHFVRAAGLLEGFLCHRGLERYVLYEFIE